MSTGIVYRTAQRVDSESLAQLARIGVSTVHECMDVERLLHPSIRPVVPGSRLAGQAVTVHNTAGNNLGVHVGLEMAGPGDVLVITPGTDPACGAGLWGGVVTVCADARKVGGVIADGSVRDIAVIRGLSFPVWSRGISPRSGGKESVAGVNVPVSCAGVLVNPGDVVVADDDGVVVVPLNDVPAVLARATDREAREEKMMALLREGDTTTYRAMGFASLVDDGRLTFSDLPWHEQT